MGRQQAEQGGEDWAQERSGLEGSGTCLILIPFSGLILLPRIMPRSLHVIYPFRLHHKYHCIINIIACIDAPASRGLPQGKGTFVLLPQGGVWRPKHLRKLQQMPHWHRCSTAWGDVNQISRVIELKKQGWLSVGGAGSIPGLSWRQANCQRLGRHILRCQYLDWKGKVSQA